MWRFLHQIPRSFKHFNGPRASVGVIVDTDDKEQDTCQERDLQSLAVQHHESQKRLCILSNTRLNDLKRRTFLWRLAAHYNPNSTSGQDSDNQKEHGQTNHEDQQPGWSPHPNVWTYVKGSNRIVEALVVGSSLLGGYSSKKNHKTDLLYRVLFSICDKDGVLNTKDSSALSAKLTPLLWRNGCQLAIKDAEGSAHDAAINRLKSDTLDAAVKEFRLMCSEYTALNESLLGHMAADEKAMSEAVEHFRISCSFGNKTACFNLGLCYESGLGVAKDLDKAKHYYKMAAAKGHCQAMYNLALLCLNGGEPDSRNQAIGYMEDAARGGLVQAQVYMGIHHMQETGKVRIAAAYFKAAAKQNDGEAQYFLGLCHEHGLGLEVNECKAAELYFSAASSGHDGAMFNLGTFVENGLGGIPVDLDAAEELYAKAVALGNQDAKQRITELKALRKQREQKSAISGEKTKPEQLCQKESSHSASGVKPSSSSPTPTLSPSHSSPSYLNFFFHSVPQLLGGVWGKEKQLFDPGGKEASERVTFFIGGDSNSKIGQEADGNKSQSFSSVRYGGGYNLSCDTCVPFHRSSTSPELSSVLACSI